MIATELILCNNPKSSLNSQTFCPVNQSNAYLHVNLQKYIIPAALYASLLTK